MNASSMEPDLSQLTEEQRQWVIEHEALWRRAYEIVKRHPELDPSGVYHVLCNLRRTPGQRLKRGLHGRLRPDRR